MGRRGTKPIEERNPQLAARAVELYHSGMTCRQVAGRLDGISHETVRRLASDAGVIRGGSGQVQPRASIGHKETVRYGDAEFRVYGYPAEKVCLVLRSYARGTGTSALSNRHGVPVSTIENWTTKAGIGRSRRKAAKLHRARLLGCSLERVAELKVEAEELYQTGLSSQEVADRLGLKQSTVYGWLRRRGVIRKKPRSTVRSLSRARRKALAARAADLYTRHCMTGREVAEYMTHAEGLPIGEQTVLGWLRRSGVTRTKDAANRIAGRKRKRDLEAKVFPLIAEGLPTSVIADRLGIHPATVRSVIPDDQRTERRRIQRRAA